MAGALAKLKHEWKLFRADVPGQRFQHHRQRMKHQPRWFAALTLILAIVLLAAGILLCFIPGPGTPLLLLGLAFLGERWKWLARQLDRAEPAVRGWWQRMKQRLKRRRHPSY